MLPQLTLKNRFSFSARRDPGHDVLVAFVMGGTAGAGVTAAAAAAGESAGADSATGVESEVVSVIVVC